MNRQEAFSALRDVVVEILSVEPAVVTMEANFREDLGADSLDLIELVMMFEDRLTVSFPQDDIESIATVGQALDLVLNDGLVSHEP